MNGWDVEYGESVFGALVAWENRYINRNKEIVSLSHSREPDGTYLVLIVYREVGNT